MPEQEIQLRDELVKVDDQRCIEYRYKDLHLKYGIDNGIKSFTFPLKYSNSKSVDLNDAEGKVLYSILHEIYGKDE